MPKVVNRSKQLAPLPSTTTTSEKAATRPPTSTKYVMPPCTEIYRPPKYFNGYYYDSAGNTFVRTDYGPTTTKMCKVPRALLDYIQAPPRIRKVLEVNCQPCRSYRERRFCHCDSCKSCDSSSSCVTTDECFDEETECNSTTSDICAPRRCPRYKHCTDTHLFR